MGVQTFDIELYNSLPAAIEDIDAMEATLIKGKEAVVAIADYSNVPKLTTAANLEVDATDLYIKNELAPLRQSLVTAREKLKFAGESMGVI